MKVIWQEPYESFSKFINKNGYKSLLIVCDKNTLNVCANKVREAVETNDIKYKIVCFEPDAIADEYSLGRILFEIEQADIFVGIGSGTISDITRYTAYKLKTPFVLFPTAPSMDGFASSVAALTINGLKTTVIASPPEAIFVDMEVIVNSPEILKKAGFGDLMGKITALLDWQLSHIIFDEMLDLEVLQIMKDTYLKTLKSVGKNNFYRNLLEGLITSGIMMSRVNSSRPASGSEHHLSHFWEYHRVKTYHGIKVGLATLYVLRFYQHFLNLDKSEIIERKEYKVNINRWENIIKKAFQWTFENVIKQNERRVRKINNEEFRSQVINRIVEKKEVIDNLIKDAIRVYKELVDSYKKLEMPLNYWEIGLDENLFKMSFLCAPNIRERFTILHLYEFLGLTDEVIQSF
ncbi:iron-containing alcohol dehydrogenase [Anaerocellum diazotrophicum]|uniref:3-dehydroquinate synthase n=1 Tax=Caldicellulosiruptor diazotrophicus TaxID=2806205 RepID=A0ABN6E8A6_9FIRM|nr:iron-containing alcohol dehydrogenase [Caldicellulosiruptor diazotrophicus]BCS81711.1 3-dehydroquinate synthase [Caldicellulosiruptor diazotrophicus]